MAFAARLIDPLYPSYRAYVPFYRKPVGLKITLK